MQDQYRSPTFNQKVPDGVFIYSLVYYTFYDMLRNRKVLRGPRNGDPNLFYSPGDFINDSQV